MMEIDGNDDLSDLFKRPVNQVGDGTIKTHGVPKVENTGITYGKTKYSKAAQFSDQEIEYLQQIMIAIGTDQFSKAMRWCVHKTWEVYGEEIEKIAEEKKKIGVL